MMFIGFDHLSACFKTVKNHKLIIAVGWQNKEGLDLVPSPPNHAEYFMKILLLTRYFY